MSTASAAQDLVEKAKDSISAALGADLHSLILYGSAARAQVTEQSDLNLLIVLANSGQDVHARLREALAALSRVEPMVFSQRDLPFTFRAFAAKFVSIRRSYKLLAGSDVLADFNVSDDELRFLVAQGLRNLKLRLTYAYLKLSLQPERYTKFVLRLLTALIVDVSEAARLRGNTVPIDFAQRIPVLTAALSTDCGILEELLRLRRKPGALDALAIERVHGSLLAILRAALPLVEQP
jgi:predicted nucleotidyltransferase